MGEGTCNIDSVDDYVFAMSVVNCDELSNDQCINQKGGSCDWNEQDKKCEINLHGYNELPRNYYQSTTTKRIKNAAIIAGTIVACIAVVVVITTLSALITRRCQK